MNKDQVKGHIEEAKGKVKKVAGKLVGNKAVLRYLSQRQPDVLTEFENIVQTVALDGK